jgi:DnaK suppressor protein
VGDPIDYNDEAAVLGGRDQALSELELERDLIERIARALRRIEEGTYGVSEVSSRPIPLERLEAIPWATTLPDEDPSRD